MNKLIWAIGFIFISALGFSQEYTKISNSKALEQKIIATNSAASTLQASFTQEKHMSILNKPFVSTGKFYYKNPDKMRWEYMVPFSYIVVLKNNKVSIKDGDDLQNYDMSNNAIFKEINNTMGGMMSGKMLEDENFSKSFYESKNAYKVVLLPNSDKIKSFIEEIHLFLNKETLLINSVEMLENGGDKTVILFENIKQNSPINEVVFDKI
ncbi:MAG: outer membrane lipoprotein carrier protein LolA [Chitinophagales bacterium]